MADNIAHLIAEITRSPKSSGPSSAAGLNRVDRRSALGIGGGWQILVWALGLATVALAVGITLTRTRPPSQLPGSHGRTVVPIPPLVAPSSADNAKLTTTVRRTNPRAVAPVVADYRRREVPLARTRILKISYTPSMIGMKAAPGPALSPLDRPSPHLTGAALERALAEDAVITKRLNLEQLRKGFGSEAAVETHR